MFDVDAHIQDRNQRHETANIHSSVLPGLSTIELNISELCNRTCSFCPRHDPTVYPNQKLFMTLETVQSLRDQIEQTDWYGEIHITGFGEPHTHPYLDEIVKIIGGCNQTFVEITTNGDRLIDTGEGIDLTIHMFKNGLDLLTVDCYDGEKQYADRIMIAKKISRHGKIRLRNHHDTGNAQELINEYGFNNRSGIMGGEGIQNKCYLPFYKTLIDWDGGMVLCCNDWHRKEGHMGNILTDGLVASWNSQRLNSIRASLSKGNRQGVCAGCSINGTKFGESSFQLWQKN